MDSAKRRRIEAENLYLRHGGNIRLIDIAEKFGVKDFTVRKWKQSYKWDEKLKCSPIDENGNVIIPKPRKSKFGPPTNNKNSVNHAPSVPVKNKNAEKHGFFTKHLPEETMELLSELDMTSHLDMLWDSILIQYGAIVRAQKIMHVKDKEEMIKELKKRKVKLNSDQALSLMLGDKDTEVLGDELLDYEEEWEFQFSWDRQATFLNSQSRAMFELTRMIRNYDELCRSNLTTEEQKLRIEKLKADIKNSSSEDLHQGIQINIVRKGDNSS